MGEQNGRVPLTKEALADRTRFQFRSEELELPEIGGFIVLKTLSVAERDALPDLVDKDGNPDVNLDKVAAIFAAAVDEPKLSVDEALKFLGDWPATALDKVIEKFGELSGNDEERSAAAGTFPEDDST